MNLVHTSDTVNTAILDNGLTAIVVPRHEAPIGTFWIWYRVGGRNEVPGLTGISHWVEHMLFKGTKQLGKGEIFRRVTANGGALNGFTWLDYTAYYETLPIGRIDLALRIEADRMVNARFDVDEVASERTVIVSEKQGSDNQPTTLLREEVAGAAFRAHAYRQGVIGYLSDLQTITRDDLCRHYTTFYQPNNAVAVFVGDLGAADALARIEAAFGGIPRGAEPPVVRTAEPAQYGERRVTVNRPAPNRVVQLAHVAVSATHPDAAALMMLDAIMSGGKGLGFGGGVGMGRSSRLYRALVSSGLCSSAGSSFALTIDPYLFGVSAVLRPESDAAAVEDVLLGEIARFGTEQVPDAELERARKQLRAQHAYGMESVSGQAGLLGSLAMVAPGLAPDRLLASLLAVTADDIQRVAATVLSAQRRTTGWLIPSDDMPAAPVTPPGRFVAPAFYTPDANDLAIDISMPTVLESRLPNGLRVVTLEPNASAGGASLAMLLRIPGGSALDGERPGIARFTGDMLTRGSAGRSFDEIAEELDGLGASIGASVSREFTDVGTKSLLEDAERVMAIFADALLRPDFPADQVEIVRGQVLSGLRQARADTRAEAEHTLRGMLYPEGHPYRERVSGNDESVLAIDHAALAGFHRGNYAPEGALVAVAGGIDHAAAVALVERHFGGWSGVGTQISIPAVPAQERSRRADRELPGKVQADIALGAVAIDRTHPDYYALSTANLILGRLGLMGRLGERVREQQGMAYYAYSALEAGVATGAWSARAGVSPENIDRTIASILDEVRSFISGGPTAEEFEDAVGNLTGSLPLGLETADSIVRVAADIVSFELGADFLRRYRGIIRALTPSQLTDALRRHIDPDRLAIAVAKPA